MVYSQKTDYTYFLTDKNGADKKVYYTKTYYEYLINKQEVSLWTQ
ncbi:MAG: hypothetical protein WCO05_02670 [Candidatus Moraniibacteriota bacterium]